MPTITKMRVCKPKYTKEIRELSGRVISLLRRNDPSLKPEAIDCNFPTNVEHDAVRQQLSKELFTGGVYCSIDQTSKTSLNLSGCRLTKEYVDKYGYNISPYTQRRGRILGWEDWVFVNDAINNVLDRNTVSANVKSLHGRFVIRTGIDRFSESDWEDVKYDNVGSMVNPVNRGDAWQSEGLGREGWLEEGRKVIIGSTMGMQMPARGE